MTKSREAPDQSRLFPRWREASLGEARRTRRVVLLTGARQCGKTTLARKLASPETEYRTLDDGTMRAAAEADPSGFVRHDGAMLIIDEVQRVPALLTAIKQVVDEDDRPGQFLLTGSANIQTLPGVQESLAGRVTKLRLRPLAQGEILRRAPGFLDRAFGQSFGSPASMIDREDLLDLAVRGGFPEAVRLDQPDRRRWHIDYIQALLDRDLRDIARIHRHQAMRSLVDTLAAWSSKYMDVSAIGAKLTIRRPTLESYLTALETLYLTERVAPWTRTDYERVGKQPKLFMTDSGLMASILGWRAARIRLDPDRSGKLIETFAFNEIMAQIDAAGGVYDLFHYRDREKREVDFVIEREDGAILAIEVKAGSSVGLNDFKHLRWFHSHMAGSSDFTGIVLYTGQHCVSFGEGLWAVPFALLWNG